MSGKCKRKGVWSCHPNDMDSRPTQPLNGLHGLVFFLTSAVIGAPLRVKLICALEACPKLRCMGQTIF